MELYDHNKRHKTGYKKLEASEGEGKVPTVSIDYYELKHHKAGMDLRLEPHQYQ